MSTDAWSLRIPVHITLAASEITSPGAVKPLYLLAPRQGYLPTLGLQALVFFQHVLPKLPGHIDPTPWFEYRGLPLRWTLPTGVLFDLLVPKGELTWSLTVHFHNMPASLLSWENNVGMHKQYLNSLKEASYICRGSGGSDAIMSMSTAAQEALWHAVERADSQAYRQAWDAVKVQPQQRQGHKVPTVPVRVLLRQHGSAGMLAVWEATQSTSRPVDALQPDGSPTLLAHLLHDIAPALFAAALTPPTAATAAPPASAAGEAASAAPSPEGVPTSGGPAVTDAAEGSSASAHSQAAAGTSGQASGEANSDPLGAVSSSTPVESTPAAMEASSNAYLTGAASSRSSQSSPHTVVVAGVQPPLTTPVAWLHAQLHASDYFLYVVVHCTAADGKSS